MLSELPQQTRENFTLLSLSSSNSKRDAALQKYEAENKICLLVGFPQTWVACKSDERRLSVLGVSARKAFMNSYLPRINRAPEVSPSEGIWGGRVVAVLGKGESFGGEAHLQLP